jgi:hypothetical protein
MAVRSIYLHCLCTLAEVLGNNAQNSLNANANSTDWDEVGRLYAESFHHICDALSAADEILAKILQMREINCGISTSSGNAAADAATSVGRAALDAAYRSLEEDCAEDLDVLSVSAAHIGRGEEKFRAEAGRREQKLVEQLEPQLQARDEVKASIGAKRWNSNPAPSNKYADMRKAAEQELRRLREGLSVCANTDFNAAANTAAAYRMMIFG